jgi:crossover junction endodeoxyribonuclease RusA
MESITLILPLPDPCLSCNKPPATRGSRFKRARVAKRYRSFACATAQAECIEETWQKATIAATFYHKDNRKRDDVNFLGMLKSAYDGIVDAGVIVDDSSEYLTTLPATFKLDPEYPRVELEIVRLE